MERILSALVTDTNCWIDLHCGGLVEYVLNTVDDLSAPDIVLHELKHNPSAETLVAGGVTSIELNGQQVGEVYALATVYQGVSAQDLSALVVAKAMNAILVTGDARLRKVATEHGVEVHGTLWILETLVQTHGLDPMIAHAALDSMIALGSRLPNDHVIDLKAVLANMQQ